MDPRKLLDGICRCPTMPLVVLLAQKDLHVFWEWSVDGADDREVEQTVLEGLLHPLVLGVSLQAHVEGISASCVAEQCEHLSAMLHARSRPW